MSDLRVAVLGVGLIGGSIGLAARRRAGAHVVGYDPDGGELARALELGAIDGRATGVAEAVAGVDVVFVAAPVGACVEVARSALAACGRGCLVSDVGSTKREIARAIDDPRFVGGHPLAGAETAGVQNADADLFAGATWYLTPTGTTSSEAPPPRAGEAASAPSPAVPQRLVALIERFGARPLAIDPGAHDRLMASVSHLPHVLANVLVAQALRAGQGADTGEVPSFRDATRVAGANPAIWTDIYMSNSDLLAEALDETIRELSGIRDALDAEDAAALTAWNERAGRERERLAGGGAHAAASHRVAGTSAVASHGVAGTSAVASHGVAGTSAARALRGDGESDGPARSS